MFVLGQEAARRLSRLEGVILLTQGESGDPIRQAAGFLSAQCGSYMKLEGWSPASCIDIQAALAYQWSELVK